jgi:hypothetical protein
MEPRTSVGRRRSNRTTIKYIIPEDLWMVARRKQLSPVKY